MKVTDEKHFLPLTRKMIAWLSALMVLVLIESCGGNSKKVDDETLSQKKKMSEFLSEKCCDNKVKIDQDSLIVKMYPDSLELAFKTRLAVLCELTIMKNKKLVRGFDYIKFNFYDNNKNKSFKMEYNEWKYKTILDQDSAFEEMQMFIIDSIPLSVIVYVNNVADAYYNSKTVHYKEAPPFLEMTNRFMKKCRKGNEDNKYKKELRIIKGGASSNEDSSEKYGFDEKYVDYFLHRCKSQKQTSSYCNEDSLRWTLVKESLGSKKVRNYINCRENNTGPIYVIDAGKQDSTFKLNDCKMIGESKEFLRANELQNYIVFDKIKITDSSGFTRMRYPLEGIIGKHNFKRIGCGFIRHKSEVFER